MTSLPLFVILSKTKDPLGIHTNEPALRKGINDLLFQLIGIPRSARNDNSEVERVQAKSISTSLSPEDFIPLDHLFIE